MKLFILLCFLIIFISIIQETSINIKETLINDKSIHNNIYILYTGGTIGMVNSPNGLIPKKGFLEEQLNNLIKNNENNQKYAKFTIEEYMPLLDSSNLYPKDWVKIVKNIANVYDKYDAFIIIHGTDTMSYTASALSFMLENLNKTVIITGSMLPLIKLRNDGHNNLINSLYIASNYTIPEVIIVFDDKIIRGCRSTKITSNLSNAFSSPNYPELGIIGVDISINDKLIFKQTGVFKPVYFNTDIKVITIKLFPGIDAQYLQNILVDESIKGVVLETFGIGDAPTDQNFLKIIKMYSQKGVIFLNITQCYMGYVDQNDYDTGVELYRAGVYSGKDMRPEAGIAKLYYLLTHYPLERIKNLIGENLRGELNYTRELYNETGKF